MSDEVSVAKLPSGGWGVYVNGRLLSDHRTRDGAVAAYRNVIAAARAVVESPEAKP